MLLRIDDASLLTGYRRDKLTNTACRNTRLRTCRTLSADADERPPFQTTTHRAFDAVSIVSFSRSSACSSLYFLSLRLDSSDLCIITASRIDLDLHDRPIDRYKTLPLLATCERQTTFCSRRTQIRTLLANGYNQVKHCSSDIRPHWCHQLYSCSVKHT
jgi:hypothetical protein